MSDRIRRSHRFTVTPEHLTLDPRVSDRAHRLWCRIDRMGAGDHAVESLLEDLSIEMDCSVSSVARALAELAAAGWIQVDRQAAGGSVYTLVVVPAKAVLKLAEEAREERRARWEGKSGQYRAATAARPVEDRKHARKDYASSQVNGTSAVTHDCTETPDMQSPMTAPQPAAAAVTSECEPQSPVSAAAVTGDCMTSYRDLEKVTTPLTPQRDAGEPADADASTRGDDETLFGISSGSTPATPGRRTGRARPATPKPPNPTWEHAKRLCDPWWLALPVKPPGARAFPNVVQIVAECVEAGWPDDEIEAALKACGLAVTRDALTFQYQRRRRAAEQPQGRPSIRDQHYASNIAPAY